MSVTRPRLPGWTRNAAGTILVVVAFLFAVNLLGTATDSAAPALERVYRNVAVGEAPALGVSWLGAYLLTNGSVVAVLALSLFEAGVVTVPELFLMIAGSRLGAAAIVLLVGALDYFQKSRYSLSQATSLGLLTFLLTHTIYLPVTVVGYLAAPRAAALVGEDTTDVGFAFDPLAVFDPLADAVVGVVGPLVAAVLAVGVLFVSLRQFDRILSAVDTATIRDHFFVQFQRKWLSFGIGLFVTSATTSVAFSLGVIVPLYNRGYVERREVIPYVLGANLGTLVDTLLVAVVLDVPVGVAVVALLIGGAGLATLAVLVVYDPYCAFVDGIQDLVLEDRRAFVGFVVLLVAAPVALVVIPYVLATV